MKHLKQQDIVEIVDYDPIKNIVLAIGKQYPCVETPVHWIIQSARHDIFAIVEVASKHLFDQLKKVLPVTDEETSCGTIERAKSILKTLQKGKNVLIKNEGVIFVGFNLKEIEDSFVKILGGII